MYIKKYCFMVEKIHIFLPDLRIKSVMAVLAALRDGVFVSFDLEGRDKGKPKANMARAILAMKWASETGLNR